MTADEEELESSLSALRNALADISAKTCDISPHQRLAAAVRLLLTDENDIRRAGVVVAAAKTCRTRTDYSALSEDLRSRSRLTLSSCFAELARCISGEVHCNDFFASSGGACIERGQGKGA